MKKYTVALALIVSFLAANVFAGPIGNQNAGRKYFIAAKDLSPWSTGFFARSGNRAARVSGIDEKYDYTHFAAYIGYDFFPWVTTYVLAGGNNTSFDGTGDDVAKPEFGFGMRFNVLHHDLLDPTLFEDVLLVNAAWQFTSSDGFRNDSEQTVQELYANVTISIVNEILGDKFYLPNGISIFAGPSYSVVESSSVSPDDNFGILLGLEVFYTKRISMYLSGEMMGTDSTSVGAGIHVCL